MTEGSRSRGCRSLQRACVLLLVAACAGIVACRQGPAAAAAQDETGAAGRPAPVLFEGRLDDGAAWIAEIPADWNGTLLLYAHGYSPEARAPESAPKSVREALLQSGYALAASAYPTAGWAVAEAVPSQVLALAAFEQAYGKPGTVIAWGSSMGGLVTSALAERHADRLSGALTMCASSMGALPMMNMAFDGAYALTTLIPADPPVAVLGNGDNIEGVGRQMAAVEAARETPAGRARVALAGVLGGIPGWTRADGPRPPGADTSGREAEIASVLKWGLFLPRGDQEDRAGGIFSWNTGIDYAALLRASGRADFVQSLYDDAGLELEADLARLNAGPRVAATPSALDYMRDNYTTTGKVGVPVLSLHTIGDGMTSPSLQRSYVDKLRRESGDGMVRALWIERAGHCTQSAAETLAALDILKARLQTGHWEIDIPALRNDDRRFLEYSATPVPRVAAGYDEREP